MDAIGRILQEKGHTVSDVLTTRQTWEDFDLACRNRRLILFGVGAGADFYYYKYGESACVEEIIDNDPELWGMPAKHVLFERIDAAHSSLLIHGPDVLDGCDTDEIVVLISSLRHYEEMARQLYEIGIKLVYSVLCMESENRQKSGIVDLPDRKQEYLAKCSAHPIDRRRVVLITTNDGAGHGRNIVACLHEIDGDLELIWFVHSLNTELPVGVKPVLYRDYRSYMFYLLTAGIWLADTGVPVSMKREGQIYIQMKHWSSVTLKMFGYDELAYRGEENYDRFGVHGLDDIDYVLVGSSFDEKTCRSGFRFTGEAVYVGSPRTDTLFMEPSRFDELRRKYHLSNNEKILLFAPTFRIAGKGSIDTVYKNHLDFDGIRTAFENRFGGMWRILLRLHPFVAELSKSMEYPGFVTDVSDYFDSEELVAIADAMITDYSSIMFELAYVGRPVFLLAVDRKEYLMEERGFLINYDSLPFPIAETNEQLARKVEAFDSDEYRESVASFLDSYGVYEDGHAAERAATFVLKLVHGEGPSES